MPKCYMVGLTDRSEEGTWIYSDGSSFDESVMAWSSGEPDNHDGDQHCVVMGFNNGSDTLYDVECDNWLQPYICK